MEVSRIGGGAGEAVKAAGVRARAGFSNEDDGVGGLEEPAAFPSSLPPSESSFCAILNLSKTAARPPARDLDLALDL